MLSRRTLLTGAGASVVAGTAGGVGVYEGWLPGRVTLQRRLGLNGEDGVVPDIATGPVEQGSFASAAMGGADTPWVLLLPPGAEAEGLPLVVALHGAGYGPEVYLPGDFGLAEWLAQVVADGTAPFAIVAPYGGPNFWHAQPSGLDPAAMVVDELLPLMAERGLRCTPPDRIGLMGWSMGGYGALRLASVLGPDRVAAVAVAGPAVGGGGEQGEEFSVFGRQGDLEGVAVSIDCGTGDPSYRLVEDYVDGFPDDVDLRTSFEAGGHDRGFWRRVLPAQLPFLSSHLT